MITNPLDPIANLSFNPDDFKIDRHRQSTTQGSFTILYKNEKVITYGDKIELTGEKNSIGEAQWKGVNDEDIMKNALDLWQHGHKDTEVLPLIYKDMLSAMHDANQAVIMSDADYDKICGEFNGNIASIPNPQRCGTLDALLVGSKYALRRAAPAAMAKVEIWRNPGFVSIQTPPTQFKENDELIEILKNCDPCGLHPNSKTLQQDTIVIFETGERTVSFGPLYDPVHPYVHMTIRVRRDIEPGVYSALIQHHDEKDLPVLSEIITGLKQSSLFHLVQGNFCCDKSNIISSEVADKWLKKDDPQFVIYSKSEAAAGAGFFNIDDGWTEKSKHATQFSTVEVLEYHDQVPISANDDSKFVTITEAKKIEKSFKSSTPSP